MMTIDEMKPILQAAVMSDIEVVQEAFERLLAITMLAEAEKIAKIKSGSNVTIWDSYCGCFGYCG